MHEQNKKFSKQKSFKNTHTQQILDLKNPVNEIKNIIVKLNSRQKGESPKLKIELLISS